MKLKSLIATTLSTCAAIATISLPVQAAIFSGSISNVRWGEPSPGDNTDPVYSGVGTGSFSWGDPDDFGTGANKLEFQPISFVDVGSDSLFPIGELSYFNGTVLIDTSVEQVPLSFDFSLDTPDSVSQSFQLDADIFNTNNDASNTPLENADTVKFTDDNSLGNFTYDGKEYEITLAGFSQDGGENISNEVVALEGETTTTRLYANITEVPRKTRVPEPGMLLGVFLVGGYCVYRRQLI
ncbi:MAG: choice-of-anchor K domain-containing protein [Calothrix sp. MO_167.B42]|nr:choice-of-anchor K domain-containing protein [Calothrix sp. MO_167.B42]